MPATGESHTYGRPAYGINNGLGQSLICSKEIPDCSGDNGGQMLEKHKRFFVLGVQRCGEVLKCTPMLGINLIGNLVNERHFKCEAEV